jgi:hypothetical protein
MPMLKFGSAPELAATPSKSLEGQLSSLAPGDIQFCQNAAGCPIVLGSGSYGEVMTPWRLENAIDSMWSAAEGPPVHLKDSLKCRQTLQTDRPCPAEGPPVHNGSHPVECWSFC